MGMVQQNIMNHLLNSGNMKLNLEASPEISIGGFIKCNWQPKDVIESYAQEKLTASISKTLASSISKLNFVEGVVSCYLQTIDEIYLSETGQSVLTHKLEVIGEDEFSNDHQ